MALIETFSGISRHTSDESVALVGDTSDFIDASRQQDVKAIIFDGYENFELDTYLSTLSEDDMHALTLRYEVLKAGDEHAHLRDKLPEPVFEAVDELAKLFFQATGEKEISFKLGYFGNKTMHHHLADQMTFALDNDGTQWKHGQVEARTPFFMKSKFMHKTPDSTEDSPRPIAIFSAPTNYGL